MTHVDDSVQDAVRARLGVPRDAAEVVIVAESTHWDPNWLVSSERYERWCVRPTLDRVLDELAVEPRRVFSVECMFFLDRYWHDRPERRGELVDLVASGRLWFTGSGVTTPDTLLPEDEMILRDALLGQEWLRQRGMRAEPRLWYFPDSFGHSPGLPTLLRSAGFDRAAICRIDGMRFPGADLESEAHFPRPGSSAAALIDAGTSDFWWRSPDGSTVLTHWMSHSYGQGDMIAASGVSRALGLPIARTNSRPRHVDQRVAGYLAHLRPMASTPYRLLPIGMDFARPVPRLVDVLDAWNARHFECEGTWLVNATIDDYLDLVASSGVELPTLELDPNPYWSGFYASRPDLKAAARSLGRRIIAEDSVRATAVLAGQEPPTLGSRQRSARWTAAVANHHDFITGTSPDSVAGGEQRRWLTDALSAVPRRRGDELPAGGRHDGRDGGRGDRRDPRDPVVRRRGDRVEIACAWGVAVFDGSARGALVSLRVGGREVIAGPSLTLESFFDSGGLWRMGQEFAGGRFVARRLRDPATARVVTRVDAGSVRVTVDVQLEGRPATLVHTIDAATPLFVTRTSVHPRLRRTVTVATRLVDGPTATIMHQPGGSVRRPAERWYQPTYWPLHSFAVLEGDGTDRSNVAIASATPTGLSIGGDATLRTVVARSAVKEVAHRVVPVMAPAWGRRWGRQEAIVATGWVAGSDDPVRVGRGLVRRVDTAAGRGCPRWPVEVDDPLVEVIAVKPADRGEGVIVRLRSWAREPRAVTVRVVEQRSASAAGLVAMLVDARERELPEGACEVVDGGIVVPVDAGLVSVRLAESPAIPTEK